MASTVKRTKAAKRAKKGIDITFEFPFFKVPSDGCSTLQSWLDNNQQWVVDNLKSTLLDRISQDLGYNLGPCTKTIKCIRE